MMGGNETTRRRRVHRRSSSTSEVSSASSRSNIITGLHQHHHHHDHHHHHYHYHHHYHHFPRPLNGDQEQGLVLSSGAVATGETSSQSELNHTERQGLVDVRNNVQHGMFSRESGNEHRDRPDERIRLSAIQSRRPGFRANLMEEFSLLFEDDEDPWSDDELHGIQEWLAAVGFEEAVHFNAQSVPEEGLSKALIRQLPRVFVPQESGEGLGVAALSIDQEDCSVCLEHFVAGQQLICLPCKHRFHTNCLIPWLERHAKCPYCRAKVRIEGAGAAGPSQTGSGDAVSLIEEDLIAWMEAVDLGLSQLYTR